MPEKLKRQSQLAELFPKIRHCIENELYRESRHARERQVIFVLKHGYHEKQKNLFWALDGFDIRIIIAFDGVK